MMEKLIKKIKINNKVLSIIMVLFSYLSICFFQSMKVYDIVSWLIFFGLIMLFLKTDIKNKIMRKEIIILSVLFSFLTVYGSIAYSIQDNPDISIFREFIKITSIIKLIGIFNLTYVLLINILLKLHKFSLNRKKSMIKKPIIVFLISFIFIFALWIPYFLNFYPGILTPDSWGEITTVINNFSSVSDHHPVLHIIFLSVPYNIGFKFTHSIAVGIAFCSIFQMLIMAVILSSFIVFLYNRKISDYILLIILLLYAILPMHGYYSVTMWKDVIFSGSVLLLSMELIKIIEKEKKKELNLKSLISFTLVSLLCVFFRNNAIYMYFVLAVITLIIFRKYYKLFIITFLVVFGVYIIVKGPIFKYFNVSKSASAEYIGMPLQQIGRMSFKHIEFTNEEKKTIDKLIPLEIMAETYNPRVSDGIKFNKNYNGNVFDKNKSEYLKLWIKLVAKHPSIAVEAYSISTLGYWYPGVEYWATASNIWKNEYKIHTTSKMPKKYREYFKKVESRYFPILNIEWSIGLCFWIILIFAVMSFKKNKIKGIYPFVPVFGIWLTMMIASPVFGEFRYVYSAFITLPLLMLCPYLKLK